MNEKTIKVSSGWTMLPLCLLCWFCFPGLILIAMRFFDQRHPLEGFASLVGAGLMFVWSIIMTKGFFTIQPNEAQVLVLFGNYAGTVKQDGFHWANPFSVQKGSVYTVTTESGSSSLQRSPNKYKISLRSRNFETNVLKVNDLRGNPIEISAVVVWRVKNTYQALFDVDSYEHYVKTQSESALRKLAGDYPYDHSSDSPEGEKTLRESSDLVNDALRHELHQRLALAGVEVSEARLTHLAYSPEIAGAMLRRQQAEAIIAARTKIVHGAVSMVEMALQELSHKKVVQLIEERKAEMVANLLVVLCAEREVDPVINTGSGK